MHLTDLIASRSVPFTRSGFFHLVPMLALSTFSTEFDGSQRRLCLPLWLLPSPVAGTGTAERTKELAEQVTKLGLEVILHLTCTNVAKEKVDEALAVCSKL